MDYVFNCDQEIEELETIILNKDIEELFEVRKKDSLLTSNISSKSISVKKQHKKYKKKTCVKNMKKFPRLLSTPEILKIIEDNEKFIKYIIEHFSKKSSWSKEVINALVEFSNTSKFRNRFIQRALALLNINQKHYSEQYIKYNNKAVLLAGGKGGGNEFIEFSYAFKSAERSVNKSPEEELPNNPLSVKPQRKRTLLSSLNEIFDPDPVTKKIRLGETVNNELGIIEFFQMPSIGLSIVPQVGVSIDSNVTRLLKYVRDERGFIDNKWVDFATSTVQKSDEKVINTDEHVFLIPYENNRSKILMRRDSNVLCNRQNNFSNNNNNSNISKTFNNYQYLEFLDNYRGKDDIENSVKCVLLDILQSVSLQEIQDSFSAVDPDNPYSEHSEQFMGVKSIDNIENIKEGYSDKLSKQNIKVVDLDVDLNKDKKKCKYDYCKLGCICSSLNNKYLLQRHCGLVECMFNCLCNLNEKENNQHSAISSYALVNLQYQLNKNLPREKTKFQKTIIPSEDQTSILGACHQEVKLPKRFDENTTLSPDEIYDIAKQNALKTTAKVVLHKLPSEISNCDYWCMTHQLYKCFCNGKSMTGTRFCLSEIFDDETFSSTLDSIIPIESKNHDTRTSSNLIHNRKVLQKSKKENGYDTHKNLSFPDLDLESRRESSNSTSFEVKNNPRCDSINKNNAENEVLMKPESLNNCSFLKIYKDLKSVDNIDESIENNHIILSWVAMMAQYILGKIHIWITCQNPYEIYITLVNSINHKNKCVNIKEAEKELLQKYPPYTIKIVNKMDCHGSYIVLENKKYAWEIKLYFQATKKTQIPETTNLPTIKLSKSNMVSSVSKIRISKNKLTNSTFKKIDKNDENCKDLMISKKTNIAKNSFLDKLSTKIMTLPNTKTCVNDWCAINIGDDFDEIKFFKIRDNKIISEVVASSEYIFEMLKFNNNHRNVIRVLSMGKNFAIFAIPRKRTIFFGPFNKLEHFKIGLKNRQFFNRSTECNWLKSTKYSNFIKVFNTTFQEYATVNIKLITDDKYIPLNASNANNNSMMKISYVNEDGIASAKNGNETTESTNNSPCKIMHCRDITIGENVI